MTRELKYMMRSSYSSNCVRHPSQEVTPYGGGLPNKEFGPRLVVRRTRLLSLSHKGKQCRMSRADKVEGTSEPLVLT